MRLVLDLTTNHTGDTHEWFRAAQADAGSEEAGYYLFTEHPDRYVSWLDVPSLPKLDQRSAALRARLTRGEGSVTARFLDEPVLADGWRIDVANMTGRHGAVDLTREVAREMRGTLRRVRARTGRDTWLVAEHGHDATGDLDGDGWHGTMNYTGFTRPLWAWLAEPGSALNWLGLPMTTPRLPGGAAPQPARLQRADALALRLHSQNQPPATTRPAPAPWSASAAASSPPSPRPGGPSWVPTVFAGTSSAPRASPGSTPAPRCPWPPSTPSPSTRVIPGTPGSSGRCRGAGGHPHPAGPAPRVPALRRGGLRWLHTGTTPLWSCAPPGRRHHRTWPGTPTIPSPWTCGPCPA